MNRACDAENSTLAPDTRGS